MHEQDTPRERGHRLLGLLTGCPLAHIAGSLDTEGAALSGMDLDEQSLDGLVLRGADLSRTSLVGTTLRGAVLSGADLTWADLRGADLTGAILHEADLRGARFDAWTRWPEGFDPRHVGALGPGVVFAGGSLRRMDLSRCDLTGADLRGADLTGADLRGADLSDADLTGRCSAAPPCGSPGTLRGRGGLGGFDGRITCCSARTRTCAGRACMSAL